MIEPLDNSFCISYGLGRKVNLPSLLEELSISFPVTRYRDVYHLNYHATDIFIFDYGVIVCWGGERKNHRDFVDSVANFIYSPIEVPTKDEFTYSKGEGLKIQNDHIVLSSVDTMDMLSISHAVAQSSKLSYFEESAETTVATTRHIPETLAQNGKIKMGKVALSKMRGRLFLVKAEINLQHGLLDTPEFFWEYPELEPTYMAMNRYLDIHPRIEVLNRKMEVIHELFSMLADEQNHYHSSKLEWIIIVLITLEICVFFLHDVLKLF